MHKFVALFVILCGISAGFSTPVRKAIVYQRQTLPYMARQQTMYGFHYQNQQRQNDHRSTGVSAFAVGNMAPGSYLKNAESAELPAQDDQDVHSFAEALPESDVFPAEDETLSDVPTDSDQEADETNAYEPAAAPAFLPAVPAVIPVAVSENEKKVFVQTESDEDEEEVQVSRRGTKVPALPNSYFPINFGSTNGGAIAVANSYSTGKGGSATSTSNAYGSPAAAELRRVPVLVQLRRKPAKLRARKH
ncbi:uncharacterized protein LOC129770978 isoform X2 [Toxorhynchites rutilus septentrionalis]|uniref:uncharacterized protein LOC129770978 isoform X2 n=1 Tax=Toxorhynchites rutilus septentrionalis TaxID=329112 RepID=UPI0024798921|nr:uncharacterized protein LOC129770978 isoform X2 [Toxorhynchites rutilus septentrionalis]